MLRNSAAFSVLVGGGIGGACDITYAILYSSLYGVTATRVLQSVASGLLGARSFEGGTSTAALGLALHFFIAFSWAAIYWLASRRLPVLLERPIAAGLAYGFLIFAVMNLVVIPLSATPPRTTFRVLTIATGLIVHMALIGVPIALATRRSAVLVPA